MTKKIFNILVLTLLMAACTEKIDLKLDSTYTRLVVYGTIETDTGLYQVSLSKTTDYFSNIAAPRVVNATVTLSDESMTYALHESKAGISGIYETDSTFTGKKRTTYSLHINLENEIAGNKTYDASCILPSVTTLDSIDAVLNMQWGKKGVWTVKLWAQEPRDTVNYYLFNLYKNGKLVTDTITEKVISDDMYYNGSYMNGVDVIYINNAHDWETLHSGDTITLQMSGISKEYYDFLNQVSQSMYNIPFFSGPPANVKGNISNGGIGFFAAFSNSYATTIVK